MRGSPLAPADDRRSVLAGLRRGAAWVVARMGKAGGRAGCGASGERRYRLRRVMFDQVEASGEAVVVVPSQSEGQWKQAGKRVCGVVEEQSRGGQEEMSRVASGCTAFQVSVARAW
jgi:hypothetical protein